VVVLDEAYVDFAEQDAMALALKYPNVLVARTFSKAYSLCFQRVGYMVGPVDLIQALHKIRDSYNVNGLGQIAAAATLDDLPYYRKTFERIIQTREALAVDLRALGFEVGMSETNFLLVQPPDATAEEWLGWLREQKVLVRWFDDPHICRFLRITVGTEAETAKLIAAVKTILARKGRLVPSNSVPA
jgi:histidinol-phosphate aminotransferase